MWTINRRLGLIGLALAMPAFGDTFNVLVVDNAYDLKPEPFESPRLESASKEWLKYLDRVIYSPTPINLGLADVAFASETLGAANVRYLAPGDAHEAELGLDSRFSYTQSQLVALGADYVSSYYALNQGISIDSETSWDVNINRSEPSELYYVLAHELLHGLGFHSRLSVFGENDPLNGQWGRAVGAQPGIFDSFMRSSGDLVVDMTTNEERAEVFYNQDNVVFSGPVTSLYAQELLSFGASDGVQLNASSTYKNITLSHFSYAIDPDVLMEPSGDGAEMFVSFAVLADLGYGDMLDTQVRVHSVEADSAVFSVRSDTLQERDSIDNVILTIPAKDGLTVESFSENVSCAEVDGATKCDLGGFATNSDHLFRANFAGTPGIHTVIVDVEHRAPHVDAAPLNNFSKALIQVGENPIAGVILDPADVDEGTGRGVVIGNLTLDSTSDVGGSVLYSLVAGDGDTHNGNVELVGSEILTSASLDHENVPELSVRIRAILESGFSYEQSLLVAVNDTDSDGCFDNRVVFGGGFSRPAIPFVTSAYASTGVAGAGSIGSVLFWLFNAFSLGLVQRSTRLGRRWKQALVVVLTLSLFGCGGGGGGGSSLPPVASC
jgi:hypothetical protein